MFRKIQNGKSLVKWQSKDQTHEQNDLVRAFCYVFLKTSHLCDSLYNSIIMTIMREQNKQTR